VCDDEKLRGSNNRAGVEERCTAGGSAMVRSCVMRLLFMGRGSRAGSSNVLSSEWRQLNLTIVVAEVCEEVPLRLEQLAEVVASVRAHSRPSAP
jgi:hypothetical protein